MNLIHLKNRPLGSMIVAALLLFSLLLALGLGLMSAQASRMKAAIAQTEAIQAKSLALAGWADVKGKIGKDQLFPPATRGQDYFSYSEDLFDEVGDFFGTYTVVIDSRFERFRRDNPAPGADSLVDVHNGLYLVTCIGKVGPRGEEPTSERVLYFEIDMETFRVLRTQDRGSL